MNRCGCTHWTAPKCPAKDCPWQGKRPVDALPERCDHGLRWEHYCRECDGARGVQGGAEGQPE